MSDRRTKKDRTPIWFETNFSIYILYLHLPGRNFINQTKAVQQSPPAFLRFIELEGKMV